MRLNRQSSLAKRRSSQILSGCLPFVLVLSLLCGFAWFSRVWWRDWVWNRLHPNDAQVSLGDAQSAYEAGELERSIQASRQIYANQPANMDALTLLVRSLIYRSYADYNQDRDRSQALQLAEKASQSYPLNLAAQALYAYALQANENYDEAERIALRVIRQDREQISARLTLSLAYGSQGLFDAALREANIAVTIANSKALDWRADAYRTLALAYSALGQYYEAAQAIETAITYQRRLVPLHFERALYAVQVGDMDTATAYYFNVIAFDSENIKARLRLCEISSTLREREAAISYCNDVTNRAPGWSDAWYYLGREYYLQGNWLAAEQAMARCTSLQVAQVVPIEKRRLECWYIQGQAAEVLNDCPTLLNVYAEFLDMVERANLPQTWTYPQGVPPLCADFATPIQP